MVDPELKRKDVIALEDIVREAVKNGDVDRLRRVHEVLQPRSTRRSVRLRNDVRRLLRYLESGTARDGKAVQDGRAPPPEQPASGTAEPFARADLRPEGAEPAAPPAPDALPDEPVLALPAPETRPEPEPDLDVDWIRERTRERGGDIRMRFDETQLRTFVRQIQTPERAEWFDLRSRAERLALLPGFEELIALDLNTIEEMPHQTDTAVRVLRNMGGRALLADEVGLGKTIEAGLVLKELLVRRLIRRVLILCPAALVDQWREEMRDKFFVDFHAVEEPAEWEQTDLAVASLARARHPVHRPHLTALKWDLVIVDEAHKVKNHRAVGYQTVQEIERDFILLVTATPLQNDLREFYNLVTLLRPGQFGTWREFRHRYMAGDDRRMPTDPEGIRDVASQVMIRNRRANIDLHLPPRRPHRPPFDLTEAEAGLYDRTRAFLRELYRNGLQPDAGQGAGGALHLALIHMAQRLCSSAPALGSSLAALARKEGVKPEYRSVAEELAREAKAIRTHAKLRVVSAILASHERERIVVFSEHRPTLDLLARHVEALGRPVLAYHGGLGRSARALAKRRFADTPGSVFLSSRSGTEGLNLQFAHVLVNFELPWNPLRVEQRIGRVHRIGQKEEVFIYNLAAHGTVEDRILQVLQEKIHLFELVVGELDLILGRFKDGSELESRFAAAWLGANDEEAFDRDLEDIGRDLTLGYEEGKAAENRTSFIAPPDQADQLEADFSALSIPARIRRAYGTRHMKLLPGVEAHRMQIGLKVDEIRSALLMDADVEDAGRSDYGPTVWVRSATSRGRAVSIRAAADRLPITVLEIRADVEAPLVPGGDGRE